MFKRPDRFMLATLWGIATLLLVVMPGCAATAATPNAGRQPNIILIMADDIGAECFGSYGGESYKTPRLDEMARTGLRFTHCYSQPLCTPTRVQLMTGQSNIRNYVRFGVMDPSERTFGHVLRDAGYATAVAGKWQLYGSERARGYEGKGMHPRDAGFDEYCMWQIDRVGSRYWDPVIERDGRILDGEGRYGPDVFTDFICDFATRHRDRPFFVYYPMALTHDPFVPTPDADESNRRPNPRHFASMVHYMDAIVGRIVDHLDTLGLRDDTVVIFTTDNGTHKTIVSRAHGREVRGGKGLTTNAGTHVPLIVSWPGHTPTGALSDDLVDTTDFLPTLAELGGASLPTDRVLDGQSFAPQLQGKAGQSRPWIYSYYNPLMPGRPSKESRSIRDHRWKLYGTGEFYDLDQDPLEQQPLSPESETPQSKAARAKLQVALHSMPANADKIQPDEQKRRPRRPATGKTGVSAPLGN